MAQLDHLYIARQHSNWFVFAACDNSRDYLRLRCSYLLIFYM